MFVSGHIGKLGTGSADKCKTTIFVEALDARKLDWALEIDGNNVIWHLTDASGFNPITITPDGTPIAVYERCALTDKEIIVFTGGSASPTYDIYDYSGVLGTIVAFDAHWVGSSDKLQAYAATPNGDVYFFDSSLGNFTHISNFGSVVKCVCFWGYDSEESTTKTYGLILTSTGDLYRITEDDPNSITLVMQNVRCLGYDIG